MDIEKLIIKEIEKKKKIKVADIVKITGFSRAYVNRFFKKLVEEGKILLIGRARQSFYVKASKKGLKGKNNHILKIKRTLVNKNLSEDLILEQIKQESGIFFDLPNNVRKILDYAFTEMLNNAIDHSKSKNIKILLNRGEGSIRFDVIDEGIGIFNNIAKKKNLSGPLEAIQELTKGKQTTAPKFHSGEGIFFTSKLGNTFLIRSSDKKLLFNTLVDDFFISNTKEIKGTRVTFNISVDSKNKISNVFRKYSSDDKADFTKTEISVKLYKMGDDLVSRSQAKRLVTGLSQFKKIELDFDKVDTVGQGFIDQIFRIWQYDNPEVKILHKNTNKNIDFMIKRAI